MKILTLKIKWIILGSYSTTISAQMLGIITVMLNFFIKTLKNCNGHRNYQDDDNGNDDDKKLVIEHRTSAHQCMPVHIVNLGFVLIRLIASYRKLHQPRFKLCSYSGHKPVLKRSQLLLKI